MIYFGSIVDLKLKAQNRLCKSGTRRFVSCGIIHVLEHQSYTNRELRLMALCIFTKLINLWSILNGHVHSIDMRQWSAWARANLLAGKCATDDSCNILQVIIMLLLTELEVHTMLLLTELEVHTRKYLFWHSRRMDRTQWGPCALNVRTNISRMDRNLG